MRHFSLLLLLTACADKPDADGTDTTGDDTDLVADDTDAADDTDTLVETDATDDTDDTEPPGDPCYASATTIQLGDIDEGFRAFSPDLTVRLGKGEQGGGAWHLEWAANVTYAPQLLRVAATLTDVETGLVLSLGREADQRNIQAVPPVLGQPWACVGLIPESNLQLDPRGMDEDESVDEWIEVCGRTVRLDVVLRDALSVDLGSASVELVLAPFLGDAESCP